MLAFNDWLAVADYSPNKELAAEWLKAAFSKENNNKWNETMGLIPARNDSQYGYVTESAQLQKEAELASQYGVGFAGIKEAAKLSTIMQDALGKLITDELTPADVVAKIQEEYLAALQVSFRSSPGLGGRIIIAQPLIFLVRKVQMPENPYLNAIITALLALTFIVVCCYGLGYLARGIVKARGASPNKQANTLCRILLCCSMDCWFPDFCGHPTGFLTLLEFYRLPCYLERPCPMDWTGKLRDTSIRR